MTPSNSIRTDAIAIWEAGVTAVNGRTLVERFCEVSQNEIRFGAQTFSTKSLNKVVVVGFGKAVAAMATGLENQLEELSDAIKIEGLVSVPEGQTRPTKSIQVIATRPAGENLPTNKVVATSKQIMELVRSAGPSDLCICLISGGGSALFELPIAPVTIQEIRKATTYLSRSGATVYQLNSVRRVISQVKGGGLAKASGGAPIVALMLSDVIGDNLEFIASGPTVVQSQIQPLLAIDVLEDFDPNRQHIAKSIWEVVESQVAESVGFQAPDETGVYNFVIGNIEHAMSAAKRKASELGYQTQLTKPLPNEGDAETVGNRIPQKTNDLLGAGGKRCLITGGETTVRPGDHAGVGGRNQHLVLCALSALVNEASMKSGQFCLLSGGTDGEDGNTSVAGAIIDDQTIANLTSQSVAIESALQSFNSHEFHSANNTLFESGQTWTNVCDLRLLLTQAPPKSHKEQENAT